MRSPRPRRRVRGLPSQGRSPEWSNGRGGHHPLTGEDMEEHVEGLGRLQCQRSLCHDLRLQSDWEEKTGRSSSSCGRISARTAGTIACGTSIISSPSARETFMSVVTRAAAAPVFSEPRNDFRRPLDHSVHSRFPSDHRSNGRRSHIPDVKEIECQVAVQVDGFRACRAG